MTLGTLPPTKTFLQAGSYLFPHAFLPPAQGPGCGIIHGSNTHIEGPPAFQQPFAGPGGLGVTATMPGLRGVWMLVEAAVECGKSSFERSYTKFLMTPNILDMNQWPALRRAEG